MATVTTLGVLAACAAPAQAPADSASQAPVAAAEPSISAPPVATPTPSPSASPTATPVPSPTPSWTTFTSERYHYSIGHPVDWEVFENPSEWDPSRITGSRGSGTDTITHESLSGRVRDGAVWIVARQLEEGVTLEDFANAVAEVGDSPCGPPLLEHETTLGSEPALYMAFSCNEDPFYIQITALHGGRGYVMWMASSRASGLPRADVRPINQQFIESFQFTD